MVENIIEREKQQFTYSVQIPGGAYITRKLNDGDTVSVGSDDTADLRLDSPGIAGMHCLLTVDEGRLSIKDCYSAAGTFVNGQRVQDIKLKDGCRLNIAEIEIEVRYNNQPIPDAFQTFVEPTASPSIPKVDLPPPVDATELIQSLYRQDEKSDEAATDEEIDLQRPSEPTAELSRLLYELEEAKTENEVLRERLKSVPKHNSASTAGDPFQAEMLDLMRQEIEALQQELEKRNSQDFAFELSCENVTAEQLPKREEVEKLVERLEDLVDELQQKDEQIQVLQDLVLAGDTANQAEQEEREQLAKWLGEFEDRFELLTGEWQAEKDQLKEKVERLELERVDALAALSADSNSVKSETLKRMTDSLRDELAASQEEISDLRANLAGLERKLKEAEHSSPKEEEIRLARERAEIARMRHDLEIRIQKHEKVDTESGEVEQKLRSLTAQLREPHKVEKENPSLSGRFLSLWTRLNG